MKTVKYFRAGDSIPDDAKYLRSETVIIGYEPDSHVTFDDYPIYGVRHLYEIPTPQARDSVKNGGDL